MAITLPALAATAIRAHGTPAASGMSGDFWGIPADHLLGLIAPLTLPLALAVLLPLLRARAAHGGRRASRWLAGYANATPLDRAAALLLVAAAAIHLGLVPGHWSEERGLALLFVVNAAAFAVVGGGVFLGRWWRPAAIVLLLLTTLAYVGYVGNGHENLDPVGMITLLVELAALGVALMPDRSTASPSRGRLALAGGITVATVVVSGGILWGAEMKAEHATGSVATMADMAAMDGHPMQGMVMEAVPNAPPTPAQQAAATRLADETKAAIAKYEDVNLAIADGYRPESFGTSPTTHWANARYGKDGRTLDPARPEDLVYANTPNGPVLLGAMFSMQKPGSWGPDFGGPITDWHQHDNVCVAPLPTLFAGFLTPFDSCPAGTVNLRSPAMIHLWTVDVPGGPWAPLDPDQVAQMLGLTGSKR